MNSKQRRKARRLALRSLAVATVSTIPVGLPSAADLDRVAEEQSIARATAVPSFSEVMTYRRAFQVGGFRGLMLLAGMRLKGAL